MTKRNDRKFLLAMLLLFMPSLAYAGAPLTGVPVVAQKTKMVVGGKAVDVLKVGFYYHRMDLPPHSRQPIGLEEFLFIQMDAASGNADKCMQWFDKVSQDEKSWSHEMSTYPYFEVTIHDGAQAAKSDGVVVFQDQDVHCWEASDFGPPLY